MGAEALKLRTHPATSPSSDQDYVNPGFNGNYTCEPASVRDTSASSRLGVSGRALAEVPYGVSRTSSSSAGARCSEVSWRLLLARSRSSKGFEEAEGQVRPRAAGMRPDGPERLDATSLALLTKLEALPRAFSKERNPLASTAFTDMKLRIMAWLRPATEVFKWRFSVWDRSSLRDSMSGFWTSAESSRRSHHACYLEKREGGGTRRSAGSSPPRTIDCAIRARSIESARARRTRASSRGFTRVLKA